MQRYFFYFWDMGTRQILPSGKFPIGIHGRFSRHTFRSLPCISLSVGTDFAVVLDVVNFFMLHRFQLCNGKITHHCSHCKQRRIFLLKAMGHALQAVFMHIPMQNTVSIVLKLTLSFDTSDIDWH